MHQSLVDKAAYGRAVKLLAGEHPFGELTMLNPKDVKFDTLYQRPISQTRVQEICRQFDPKLFQVLDIGKRGGDLFIIDGQHRLASALTLGLAVVPARIWKSTGPEMEALYYVLFQDKRKNLLPVQRFAAKLAYRDQTAVDIYALLQKYNFHLEHSMTLFGGRAKKNVVLAIGLLEQTYRKGGAERVDDILFVLRKAWNGQAASLTKTHILGLREYMSRAEFSRIKLAGALKGVDPVALRARAFELSARSSVNPETEQAPRKTQAVAMAELIERIYDKYIHARE